MEALTVWRAWRAALRGEVSEETWRQYVPAALRFLALADLIQTPIGDITRADVLTFFGEHYARGGQGRTHVHAALVSFFRFAVLEGIIDVSPMQFVDAHRVEQPEPEELTPEELCRLLAALKRRRGERASLVVSLAYLLGLRRKELAGLRWDEIVDTPSGPVARLSETKGGRPRTVELSPEAMETLERIRDLPPRYMRADRAAFVAAVSKHTVSEWVHDAALEAGIPARKAHSHILRSSAATHMLRGGANVRVVQRILGHAKLETTARYLAVTGEERREAVSLLSVG